MQGEMAASAIHPDLVNANVHYLDSDDLLRLLLDCTSAAIGKNATQYFTAPLTKLQKLYEPLTRDDGGGWAVFGCTIDGHEAEVPIVKPNHPRIDFQDKGKSIKYETPARCVGSPILSFVPDTVAELTWQRFSVAPGPEKNYWQNVRALNLPITLTEGWKKAAALISQGYPAIALRGITMWHPKGDKLKVHPEIEHFCSQGRRFYIAFDEDIKESTRKNVHQQAVSLGWCLQKTYSATVQLLSWDSTLGKGIDDVIVAAGEQVERTLSTIYQNPVSLMVATYGTRDEQIRSRIIAARTLTIQPERSTTSAYLPILPPLKQGKIHLVDAGMGSGKTARMGQDWVRPAPQCDLQKSAYMQKPAQMQTPFTLLLTPMNALGRQTAHRWNLAHIHDLRGTDARQIWGLAKDCGGIAMCIDSLHKLPDWLWSEPLLLVFDEVNQSLDNAFRAGTMGDRQSPLLKTLTQLCRHAIATGSIIAAEDGILRHSVQALTRLAGVSNSDVRLFQHTRIQSSWDCIIHKGNISQVSGFRSDLMQAVSTGKKILFVTSSQLEGKSLECALMRIHESKALANKLQPTVNSRHSVSFDAEAHAGSPVRPLKVVRVDSETNEGKALQHFFTEPDKWIEEQQPDVLIISPSAKSGVSIESPYFDEVWAFFPALDATTHWQLLGRYRQPVPRHIFIPERIMASPLEQMGSARQVRQYIDNYSKHLTTHLGISAALNHDSATAELDQEIQTAMTDFYCYQQVLEGAQKAAARDNLMERLEQAGHQVSTVHLVHNSLVADLWADIREDLEIEEAEALAAAQILDKHTAHWAHQQLSSKESTYGDRIIARKVLLRIDFPGMMFDDNTECYKGITQYKGTYKKGTTMYARMLDLESTRKLEKQRALEVLSQDVKALHRLPKTYIKARLLGVLGLPQLLETLEVLEIYNSESPEIQQFKQRAIAQKEKIWMFLGLNIDEDQSGVEIFHKILKKHLGIRIQTRTKDGLIDCRKIGPRGAQVVFYQIRTKQCEIYQQMLQAAQVWLKERISDFHKQKNNQEITDTKTPPISVHSNSAALEFQLDDERYRIRAKTHSCMWLAPLAEPDLPLEQCLIWHVSETTA